MSGGFTVARPPAPHDYTDNGSPDILARDSSGVLWREDTVYYPESHQLTGSDRVKVGPGWNSYSRIVAVGNVAGSSAGDLIARDNAGVLWLYTGTGKGTFAARTKIGPGWNVYTQMFGIGDSNIDGKPDLITRDSTGTTWRYLGTGNAAAPFAKRELTGVLPAHPYNTAL
ncbi:hypothetical protein ABZX65_07635 [Streptomyces sp. NPDC003300]|uniref:hypothetical protein n=1 Tax=unclassified Streptomyces TaxID=2593676 RepID=UPI0033AF1B76